MSGPVTHLPRPDHDLTMSTPSATGDFADSLSVDLLDTVRNAPSPAPGRVARIAHPWGEKDPHGSLSERESFDLVFDVNLANRYASMKSSNQQRAAAVEFVIRRCVTDPSHAEALIAMWRTGGILVHASTAGADKDGIFEHADGDCLREYDAPTSRQVISISIEVRGWIDSDGTTFRADGSTTALED